MGHYDEMYEADAQAQFERRSAFIQFENTKIEKMTSKTIAEYAERITDTDARYAFKLLLKRVEILEKRLESIMDDGK